MPSQISGVNLILKLKENVSKLSCLILEKTRGKPWKFGVFVQANSKLNIVSLISKFLKWVFRKFKTSPQGLVLFRFGAGLFSVLSGRLKNMANISRFLFFTFRL